MEVQTQDPQSLLRISDDREFIQAAYRSILDRDCDPAGLVSYLEALNRHVPRRVILSRIAQSREAQAKPGAAVSYWAGSAESRSPRAALQRLRVKSVSLVSGIVKRVLLSRFDAIDNRLMLVFQEMSAKQIALSRKIDETSWTVSEKLDGYVAHLNRLQKDAQTEIVSGRVALIEQIESFRFGIDAQMAAMTRATMDLSKRLDSTDLTIRGAADTAAEVRSKMADMTRSTWDFSKRMDAIENVLRTGVAAAVEVRSELTTVTNATLNLRQRLDKLDDALRGEVGEIQKASEILGHDICAQLQALQIQENRLNDGVYGLSAGIENVGRSVDVLRRTMSASVGAIQQGGVRFAEVDGLIFGFPAEEWRLAAYLRFRGFPERGLLKLFQELIRPGMTIVDVGSSFGIFTLHALRALQGHGRIHSFEPTPRTYTLLRGNVQVNGFLETGIVQFHEAAVTDCEGTARFQTFADNSTHNTLYWPETEAEPISVNTTSLDTALQDEPRVDVVKIDAEGAEYGILQGMRRTIEKNPGVHIILEFAPIHLARADINPADLLKLLNELELDIQIVDDATGALRDAPPEELLGAYSANLYLRRRGIPGGIQ